MICKKCGGEYEDDMLKCLWCDAPNENHVAPEKPELIHVSEILDTINDYPTQVILNHLDKDEREIIKSEEHQKNIEAHPAGNFMWCAAILGTGGLSALLIPFYVAFFHRNALNKRGKTQKFIFTYFSAVFALVVVLNLISRELLKIPSTEDVNEILKVIVNDEVPVIYYIICGYTSAFLLKNLTPGYDVSEYKVISKSSVIYSIPVMMISAILSPVILQSIS